MLLAIFGASPRRCCSGLRGAGLLAAVVALAVSPPQGPGAPLPGEAADRADLYGDPLPPYAVARMGTVRLRDSDRVTYVAFTPDCTAVVSGSGEPFADGTLRLWDAATGKELRRFVGHERGLGGLAICPDGKMLATTSEDGTARLWDLKTGKELHKLTVGRGPTFGVAFSPDGKLLATGDVAVTLWDIKTGKQLHELEDLPWKRIKCLAYNPDGKSLVSGDWDGTIRFWDVSSGKITQRITGHVKAVHSLAFSPDGSVLASAGADNTLRQWKVSTGQELRLVMKKEKAWAGLCLALSPDGKIIAGAGGQEDGLIHLFAADTGKELKHFEGQVGLIESLAFSSDGKTLVSGSDDSTVRLWDVATGKELLASLGSQSAVYTLALSPDATTLAVSSAWGSINCYDAATGKLLRRLAGHPQQFVGPLAFAPDGKTLFSAASGDAVRSWNVTTGENLHCLQLKKDNGYPSAFSPDRKTVAISGWEQPLRLLDVTTGKELRQFGQWHAVAFSPDGKALATANYEGDIRLWEVATGKELRRIRGSRSAPERLAFSPDGRWLATGADDRDGYSGVQLWSLATGEELHRLRGHKVRLGAIAFSPDSRTLATAGDDRTILLWEVSTGRQRAALTGHQGPVFALAFSRDGRRLASGSKDATALLWDLSGSPLEGQREPGKLAAKELEGLWADLAADDAAQAYRAVRALTAAPQQAVPFLRERVRPVPAVDPRRLARWLADLDSNDFSVREKASTGLRELSECAEPALHKSLQESPSAEVRQRVKDLLAAIQAEARTPPAPQVRTLRALEVLEQAATPEAKEALEHIGTGAPEARVTREAKASLRRLANPVGSD